MFNYVVNFVEWWTDINGKKHTIVDRDIKSFPNWKLAKAAMIGYSDAKLENLQMMNLFDKYTVRTYDSSIMFRLKSNANGEGFRFAIEKREIGGLA